ncbi:MAG: sterol desaturase family protein [Acidimicrobiia bacterium]
MALTLGDAGRNFIRRPGPAMMLAGAAAAGLARSKVRRAGRADITVAAAVIAVEPFTEWCIHRFVLHAPIRRVRGRTVDIGAGHRNHHRDPDDLDVALVPPVQIVAFWGLIAAQVALVARMVRRGRGDLASTLTGVTIAYGALVNYEWTHYLFHTTYKPKTAWFRRLRANHRLHHWRNEHYWLGVTSNLGDRVLRTLPSAPNAVPLSETAHRRLA